MSLPALGFLIFRGALGHLPIHLSLVARFEGAGQTVKLSRYVSAVLSFIPRPIGSPVKGSRQLCCRGVELKPINYQLSALGCGQRSLVGSRLARSVCHGFAGTHRSGCRNNRIGISADAPLKNRLRQMRCNYIRAVGATFFQWRIHIVPMRLLRWPGVEVTDEIGKLLPNISAVLNSAPHP